MKRQLTTLTLCIGLGGFLASAPVLADNDTTAASLQTLDTIDLLFDRAAMSYHMLQLDNGNPAYKNDINNSLEQLNSLQEDYTATNGNNTKLAKNIASFATEVHSATAGQLLQSKIQAQRLIATLQKNLTNNTNANPDKLVSNSMALAAMLQTITLNYINQVAGTASADDDSNQLIEQFSDKLAQFDPKSEKILAIVPKVKEVKNKWGFIENSVKDASNNPVPFLVYRYSLDTVETLLDIVNLYNMEDETPIAAPTFGAPS